MAPIDDVSFDAVRELDNLFAQPNALNLDSLNSLDNALTQHQDVLTASIMDLMAIQTSSNASLQTTQAQLAELFDKVDAVRARAASVESNIVSMTADIKRLDNTKRNLTLSMTALKRLQMLTTAYDQLKALVKMRQYRDAASLVQAVLQLMKHFSSYRSVDQIATLSRNVAELQRELLEQICEDFEICFAKGEVAARKGMLAEACLVMDALGENARARIITWYINTELREYRQVFKGNDEAGSLDNIGRRFAWFKRMLKTYDDEHRSIFPSSWRVNEVLANTFCEGTRDDFKSILERSMRRPDGGRIDVNLLLSCLQETMDFEHGLEKRFASKSRTSLDTLSSSDDRAHAFDGSISEAFEPYLSLWVDSQDRHLATLLPKYRVQPMLAPDEEFTPQSVIASSMELFHFYKVTLAQCSKLSTGEQLLDLSKVLAKYLDQYAQSVLLHNLHQAPGGASLQAIIMVLNTSDYWASNTQQLEENIKKRIDSELAVKIDLSTQSDAFMGVASAAVLALVHRVDGTLGGVWREMRNTNWSRMESAGDQSSYVSELLRHLNEQSAEILPLISKAQYARAFCDNMIENLANVYLAQFVQCKPISEVGAEQALLDKYSISKGLTGLMSHSPTATKAAIASFHKRLNQSMSRIDPLLKTLQVRPTPPEGLVQAYLIHIADRSEANFRKVLEIKGLRKAEQASLTELFIMHRDGKANQHLVASSTLLTPLMQPGSSGTASLGLNLSAAAVGASAQRFDAHGFGEKLFSAARDGVQGLGGAGGAATGLGPLGDRMGAPFGGEEAKAVVEGNLKNIGRFFSGRFGQGKKESEA